jgi:preprotein translocase subunit YajC
VRDVKDDSFIIEVSDGVKIRVLKNAISMKRGGGEAGEATAG